MEVNETRKKEIAVHLRETASQCVSLRKKHCQSLIAHYIYSKNNGHLTKKIIILDLIFGPSTH
jgi:hypothetical protein